MNAIEPVSAEQLLRMDEPACRLELVRGELRRRELREWWPGAVTARTAAALATFVRRHGLGGTFAAGTGFLLARSPDTVLAPDAAFVHRERMPTQPEDGYFVGAPDLAVEVVSPDDSYAEVLERVLAWLGHGTQAVWVIEAAARRAWWFRNARPIEGQLVTDTLHGGDVLPGFEVPVADLFPALG